MSKLIVEMEMPQACPCDLIGIGYAMCCSAANTRKRIAEYEECVKNGTRPSWCPIKGELVRCGKCYYKNEKRIMDEDKLWCRKHHIYVTADWFCADGDRK